VPNRSASRGPTKIRVPTPRPGARHQNQPSIGLPGPTPPSGERAEDGRSEQGAMAAKLPAEAMTMAAVGSVPLAGARPASQPRRCDEGASGPRPPRGSRWLARRGTPGISIGVGDPPAWKPRRLWPPCPEGTRWSPHEHAATPAAEGATHRRAAKPSPLGTDSRATLDRATSSRTRRPPLTPVPDQPADQSWT